MPRMNRHQWSSRNTRIEAGREKARRLRFDVLEDRRMLAVITVTTLNDNLVIGDGVSLREAIFAANLDISIDGSAAGNGADTIRFDASLFATAETITLGGSDLDITEALTIDATALPQNVTIDANEQSRIFNITAGVGNVTLAGLTLTGGRTTGSNPDIFDDTFSGGAVGHPP